MEPKYNRLAPGPRWILALTSVVSFMVSLDSQVVATALPVIRLQLHASLAALEWTVNAYGLPATQKGLGPRHLQQRDRDRRPGRPGRGRRGHLVIPGKRRPAPDEPQVPITSGVVETRR